MPPQGAGAAGLLIVLCLLSGGAGRAGTRKHAAASTLAPWASSRPSAVLHLRGGGRGEHDEGEVDGDGKNLLHENACGKKRRRLRAAAQGVDGADEVAFEAPLPGGWSMLRDDDGSICECHACGIE